MQAIVLEAVSTGLDNLFHLLGHSWATRNVLVAGKGYGHGLGVLHLDGIHSGWQFDAP